MDKAPDLEAAFEEAKSAFHYGDTTEKVSSTAKLAGKSLFGAALFVGEIGASLVQDIAKNAPKLMNLSTWKELGNSTTILSAQRLAATVISGKASNGSALQLSSEQRERLENTLLSAKASIEVLVINKRQQLSNLEKELEQAPSKEERDQIRVKINEGSFDDLPEKERICTLIDQAVERLQNWKNL